MLVESLRGLFENGLGGDSDVRVSGLEELVEVRALLDRVEAQWLQGVVEAVRGGGVQTETGLSPTDFLADRCRRTKREARWWVTLGQRLAATSIVGDRLVDGSLSLAQAKEICRVRTKRTAELFDEHEAGLLEASDALPVDQLATLMSQWYRRADAATADKNDKEIEERRELFLVPVGDSEWMLRATLTPEQGTVVSEALEGVKQAEWEGSGDTRSPGQRRADAFTSIARFWLDNQIITTIHGQRPHVQVIVDVCDLVDAHDHHDAHDHGATDDDDDFDFDREDLLEHNVDHVDEGPDVHDRSIRGPGWRNSGRYTPPSRNRRRGGSGGMTSSGMWLNGSTVDKYLCDCILTRIVKSESVILDAGRPSRTIPHALRRTVIARDRHCRYKGCDRPASWSDVHHIVYWERGGEHSLRNCVLLCDRHHDRVHKLCETLVLHPDGRLDITGTDGITHMSHPPPDPGNLFKPNRCAHPDRRTTIDPDREAQDNDNITRALAGLQRAVAGMTDDDYNAPALVRNRLAAHLTQRALLTTSSAA